MSYDKATIESRFDELLLLRGKENEFVEFKTAQSNFDTDELGRYFSALSNEANLWSQKEAWLVFGISSRGELVGTGFRNSHEKLMSLKQELAAQISNGISFIEIYELLRNEKRVLLFQIPPAITGIPTAYKGFYFGRNHESLVPLSLEKLDRIRSQNQTEWSAQVVSGAGIDDLSKEAIHFAREQFDAKNPEIKKQIDQMTDEQFLNTARITIDGAITNTALLLLGKSESVHFLNPCDAKITWILYDERGKALDYKHFSPPFLLRVNEVYGCIRNLTYRHIFDDSLFPDEIKQYDADVIREVLHNCIAHQDYSMHGFISVKEFPDRVVFENSGSFIPGSINRLFENVGYTTQYYRNRFLTTAMVNLNMIDTISHGIKDIVFERQIQRCFPLPDYEFPDGMSVCATIYGHIINENFARLLFRNQQLDVKYIIALDAIQKQKAVDKAIYQELRKMKLVEGKYPKVYISAVLAKETGKQADYMDARGLSGEQYQQMIVDYLKRFNTATRNEIETYLLSHMPELLSDEQKRNKIRNLLALLSANGVIVNRSSSRRYAKWELNER